MSVEPEKAPDTWAIVDLLGHQRLAGRLSEEEKFGAKMGRLDIPTAMPCATCAGTGYAAFMAAEHCATCKGTKTETSWQTQYFGGSSVYKVSIVSEEVARHAVKSTSPNPVSAWDFPKNILPAPVEARPVRDEYEQYDDDDDTA